MKSQLILVAALALLVFGTVNALAQPSVAVDQLDYHPFSTVHITGTGFLPGEAVQCQVLRIDVDDNSGSEHQPWRVSADAAGKVQAAWYVTLHEAGATLRLTAKGQRSGLTAQTQFTDSYHFKGISAGPQTPNPLPAGSAATYRITASVNGGGKESVAFSCSGLPAGVTAVFTPSLVSTSPWQSTLTLTASSSMASGTYSNITVTGTGQGDDKSVMTTTISLVAGKRAITVMAVPNTKSYDGTTNATALPTLTSGTLAPGDTATCSESYDTKNVGTRKTLTPAVSIRNKNNVVVTTNYSITLVNTNAGVINAAALTITANNASKVYGQTRSYGAGSTAFSTSGLQNRETLGSVTITASGGTATNAAVGSYLLTPSGATGGTFAATNYSISYRSGTLTVTPAPLTVTADAKSKTYGNADPSLTYRITKGALVNGDSLSGALTRVAGQNAGTYAIQHLEQARQHYLLALASQESGDSVSCGIEFEAAIQILNTLSDYSNIDSSKEYMDLSKSLVEDYEKYIAQIDSLGPNASVYALREKLNQIIEQGDVTGLKIPRIEIKGTQVPLPLNEYVERATAFFMGRGRHYIERWLYLSGKYFPIMKRVFKEEGTPEELTILSMPESGLRPDARSWARAVGLWQFMKGTGSLYGLRVNWWIDERQDFEKSTRAAARHLKDLYSELGDWNLVLGAYNAGAGRIFRAMRRSGSTDFWGMRKKLPRQTRNYIPQYVAIARIILNPQNDGRKRCQKF